MNSMQKKIIYTAIGIVQRADQKILIAERPLQASFSGYWEFPGGKIEANETAEQALVREFQEEINITPREYIHLCTLEHEYPERVINLVTFVITAYEGDARGHEGQQILWVAFDELVKYKFLPANETIIQHFQKYTQQE